MIKVKLQAIATRQGISIKKMLIRAVFLTAANLADWFFQDRRYKSKIIALQHINNCCKKIDPNLCFNPNLKSPKTVALLEKMQEANKNSEPPPY